MRLSVLFVAFFVVLAGTTFLPGTSAEQVPAEARTAGTSAEEVPSEDREARRERRRQQREDRPPRGERGWQRGDRPPRSRRHGGGRRREREASADDISDEDLKEQLDQRKEELARMLTETNEKLDAHDSGEATLGRRDLKSHQKRKRKLEQQLERLENADEREIKNMRRREWKKRERMARRARRSEL